MVGSPGGSSASIWPCSASRPGARESDTCLDRAREITGLVLEDAIETTQIELADGTHPSRAVRSASATSETLCKSEPFERMLTVRSRHLAAEARRREHLARIGESGRIERAPQALHRLEVVLGEEQRHRARLVRADAVLARDRAARVDARDEDRVGQLARTLGLALDTCWS